MVGIPMHDIVDMRISMITRLARVQPDLTRFHFVNKMNK